MLDELSASVQSLESQLHCLHADMDALHASKHEMEQCLVGQIEQQVVQRAKVTAQAFLCICDSVWQHVVHA